MSNEINVRLLGFSRIDYNKSVIRKALRLEINKVRDVSRDLVSGASPSRPSAFPGLRAGVLKRAIKSKVLRSGLAAVVRPEKTKRMGEDYYPAFLVHGVRSGRKAQPLAPGAGIGKNNRRRRGERRRAAEDRAATAWRLAPRADPMPVALARRSAAATEAIRLALQLALVPRA